MERVAKFILLPALAPAAVVALYFTPVTLIGCANRGWIALGVVFASLIAGIVVGVIGLKRRRTDPDSRWWYVGAMCILVVPTLLVLGPLG